MKNILFLLILLFSFQFCLAQDIDWTPMIKGSNQGIFVCFNPDGGYTRFLIPYSKKKKAKFLIFDKKHQLTKEVICDTHFDKWHNDKFSAFNIGENSYVIKNRLTLVKGTDIREYANAKIPDNTFKPLKDFSWNVKGRLGRVSEMPYGRKTNDYQSQHLSPDGSKFMMTQVRNALEDPSKKDAFSVYVLNEDLKEVWSRMVRFNYNDKDLAISDQAILNSGEMLLLAYHNKKKENILFKISKNDIKEYTFKTPDAIPDQSRLFADNSGNIYACGLYKKSTIKGRGSNGFYIAGFSSDGKLLYNKTYPYTPEVKAKVFSKTDKRRTGATTRLRLTDPHYNSDLNIFSIVYSNSHTYAPANSPDINVQYGFVVPVYDLANGTLKNTTVIDRFSKRPNVIQSHSTTHAKNKILIFYENEVKADKKITLTECSIIDPVSGKEKRMLLGKNSDAQQPEIQPETFYNSSRYGYSGSGNFKYAGDGKFLIFGVKDRSGQGGWLKINF